MGRLFSFNRRRKKISKPRKQVGRIAAVTEIDTGSDEVQFVRNSPTYEGKYLIVKDSKHILSSQDPTPLFWVCDLSDNALLGLINRLPTSPDNFTSLADAVAWCKENGFLITSQGNIDNSVSDGLIYEIDFGDILSYPNSGTKVFNKVGGSGDLTNHALSEWVCMASNSTTALYAAPYAGTYIYEIDENGNQTTKVSNVGPTNGSFTCAEGRRYYSNKPIHLHRNGENHLFCPISLKGTQFGHYSNRYNGSTYKIYAPHGASVRQFAGTNPFTGTAYATLNLGAGELGTMTYPNENVNNYFLSDRPIIMVVYEDGGGDKSILPPADNLVYQRRNAGEAMMNNQSPDHTNGGYVLSGSYACWAIAIADGSGGDMTTHISANHITENYTWGSTVSDYQIVAPYPDTEIVVSSWDGSSWTAHETQSLNGTELSPAMSFRSGNGGFGVQDSISNDSGGANNFNGNTLWKWEGNNPFAIWINDSSNDEEKLLGWNDGWEGDTGELTNGVAFRSEGYVDLDGSNDYIDLGNDIVISPDNQGWTAEYWFNTDVAGTLQHFNSAENDEFNANWLAIYNSKLAVWNRSPGYWKYGSTTIQSNTWYQAVFVCDSGGTNYRYYINGVREGGDHVGNSWNATYSSLETRYIGRYEYNGSYSRYFNGNFKNVKMYDRALTDDEVSQNYYRGSIVTDSLVASFDAGNIVSYDAGGASNTYSLVGSVTGNLVNGVGYSTLNGGAWIFDGSNDYIEINQVAPLIAGGDFTLSAWIKGGTQDHKGVIPINTSSGGNRALFLIRNASMGIYDGGTWYIGNIDVDNDEWHHVVLTYDRSAKKAIIYVDTQTSLSVTTNNMITVATNDKVSIGQEWDGGSTSDHFSGKITAVNIYNKVLSQSEVFQNYNAHRNRFD